MLGDVQATFQTFPQVQREYLLQVREVILATAQDEPSIGKLTETLKWGQPAYLTQETKAGSTVRLGLFDSDQVAVFFHCGTTLIRDFRDIFRHELMFSKNRAIVLQPEQPMPVEHLRYCLYAALTYHLQKRREGIALGE